ncbi:alpha/beta-hydrolase [Flagelloscypha sp. PMI_526]|nr:alpha/beta-hydrolase [Flagelloscypha sp. PMI_526]
MHLAFVFALGAILALPSAGQQIVNLGYTRLLGNSTTPTGIENGNVTFFGGVRYAKPPLGDLRWRAPQRLDERPIPLGGELFDARGWGNASIQKPARVDVGSEDCLNLAIWKPTNATKKSRLPVAVYIHGGGFYANAPKAFPLYDWVSQNNSIVGVSITYRLGVLGFLGSQYIAEDGDLNAGLLDQRAGIEWVNLLEELVSSFKLLPTVAVNQLHLELLSFRASAREVTETMRPLKLALSLTDPMVSFLTSQAKLVKQGKFAPVDVMVGVTSGDGKTFCGGKPEQFITEDDIRTRTVFQMAFNSEMVVKLKRKAFAFLWNAPNTVMYQSRLWEWAGHTSDIYFLFDGTNSLANAENSFTPFNEDQKGRGWLSQKAKSLEKAHREWK